MTHVWIVEFKGKKPGRWFPLYDPCFRTREAAMKQCRIRREINGSFYEYRVAKYERVTP